MFLSLVPAPLLIVEVVMLALAFLSADICWLLFFFFLVLQCCHHVGLIQTWHSVIIFSALSGDSDVFFALDISEQILFVWSTASHFLSTYILKWFQKSSRKVIYKYILKNCIFSGTSLEAKMLWFKNSEQCFI